MSLLSEDYTLRPRDFLFVIQPFSGMPSHSETIGMSTPRQGRIVGEMQDDERPAANPSIVLREEFDNWAILFDPDSGIIFSLNPIGVFVWKCLDGNRTIRDILARVGEKCGDLPGEAETHLRDFISDLIEKGLAGYK